MKPRKYTLVCYPGEDNDLIAWLDGQAGKRGQTVSQAIYRACLYYLEHREGVNRAATQATTPDFTLEDIRQVVEASLAGLVVSGQTEAPAQDNDDLLVDFDSLAE